MWPDAISPKATMNAAAGKTTRGLKRSRKAPIRTADIEWTNIKQEKTPAVAARLHPNSLRMATKNTEKEYQIPKIIARLIKDTPTITQP